MLHDYGGWVGSTVDWGHGSLILSVRENHAENLSQHVKCLRQKNASKNWGEAGDDGIWSPTSRSLILFLLFISWVAWARCLASLCIGLLGNKVAMVTVACLIGWL